MSRVMGLCLRVILTSSEGVLGEASYFRVVTFVVACWRKLGVWDGEDDME